MDKKKLLQGFIAIVIIFLSYFALHPMIQTPALAQGEYFYKPLNIKKDNPYSAFLDNGNGVFSIHPGSKKPTGAAFNFYNRVTINLSFIAKNTSSTNIKFYILKNGAVVKKIILKPKEKINKDIKLSLNKIDTLEIWIDSKGGKNANWQKLKITIQEPLFKLKNFTIPFLWSLLFIFLLGKNYPYVGINSYIGFLLIIFAEKKNFGLLTYEQILTYMLLLFAMTFLFVLLYQELNKVKKYKLATLLSFIFTIAIYAIPLSMLIFALNYHTPFTRDALFAIFQSNTEESLAYISDYIKFKYILLFISITTLIGFLLYKQEKKEPKQIEKSLLIFLIIVFFSIGSIYFTNLRLPDFLIKGFNRYSYEIAIFKKTLAQRKVGNLKFKATKKGKGETYIIIIGESLNKNHMGIYGYLRETTPMLSKMNKKGALILFKNIYSNHTHTQYVLSLALTEANQYNKKNFYTSPSIIDVLKAAGFETYWLSNQPLYSIYDNMVSIIGTSADHVVGLNTAIGGIATKDPKYDGPLINRVQKILEKDDEKNRVIFVHLGGSHSTYTDRYPNDKFTKFSKRPSVGEFGEKASQVPTLNSYDNSVYYNDYVVASILKEFQKNKHAYTLIYMPDHAEDVINQRGHNSAVFTYMMTQIPMIAWFSNKYKEKYSLQYTNLLHHTNTLFSNDMLYDTLIGVFGIKTQRYNQKYDLSSSNYKLNPKDALTLHGKKRYTDPNNHIYWQKTNIDYLKENNLSSTITPTNIDTGAKLHKIAFTKEFSSIELSLKFIIDNNTTQFKITNKAGRVGLSFENYLKRIKNSNLKVIINTINLNNENYQKIFNKLTYLNKKFNLRKRVIIQTNKVNLLKEAKDSGWDISYKLPSQKIIKLLRRKDIQGLHKITQDIINKINKLKITKLTFHQNIYSWIKKSLEPKINQGVTYYIYLSNNLSLYNKSFKTELLKSKLLLDPKVKLLFSSYKSIFNL